MENRVAAPNYGHVNPDIAEALAWLTSPGYIAGEIAWLEAALAAGDTSPSTPILLADWRAVRAAQRRLMDQGEEHGPDNPA